MAKGTITSNEEYLRAVALPKKTETYTVISHGDIIDKVNEQLNKNGFTITGVDYFHMADGEVAKANIYLECDKDPDMGMLFTWWNSYNKQVRFGCAIGAFIHENKSTMIGTEGLSWMRKHTGNSDQEAWDVVTQLIENGNEYFDKIIVEKNKMKAMPLSIEDFGCVMGALYFEHDLITPTQASATKQAYKDSDTNHNLWHMYTHLMYGIEGMDLKKWAKSQQKLHHMIMTEYLIVQEDKVQELVDAMVEPLKANHELPLSNISGDLAETDESFEWNTTEAEIEKMEGPGIEEDPFIGEVKEVSAQELAEKHDVEIPAKELSEDEIEVIKSEKGPQESPQVEEDPEAPVEKSPQEQFKMAVMATGYSEDLTNFFITDHFDESISVEENIQGFCDWAPEKSPEPEELQEVLEVDEDTLVDDPINLAEEMTGAVEEVGDIELNNAIEISDDDFEAQLEAAFDTVEETKEEVKEEVKKKEPAVKPVENLTEPVQLLPPKESKKASPKKEEKKKPEGIKTKDEGSFLNLTAHDSLEVPAELIQEAAIIEKKMAELYGSVRPYQVNKTEDNIFVTIDESQESFYLPVE